MEVHKKNQTLSSFINDQELSQKSKHLLLELYRCDKEKLNDESFLRCAINKAAKLANATVLHLISNKFEPQGVTAIALLAESHISIHTWPESNYSAVDIFTCGQNMLPELASQYLIEAVNAEEHSLRVIYRNPPAAVNKGTLLIATPNAESFTPIELPAASLDPVGNTTLVPSAVN